MLDSVQVNIVSCVWDHETDSITQVLQLEGALYGLFSDLLDGLLLGCIWSIYGTLCIYYSVVLWTNLKEI